MERLENKLPLFIKDITKILAGLTYHISPKIVKYIVEQNRINYNYFKEIFENKIDIENYLFEGSDCVFPGIRRYISGEGEKQKYNEKYRAIIDDNTFPRHIWCFLINDKCYTGPNWKETNLNEFELAHIFTHKKSEIDYEKKFFLEINNKLEPCGEFTSAANVVLLPKGTVRPTDTSPVLKSVFYKRYIELYGESTLNGRKGFNETEIPPWYSEIKWNEPFLPLDWKININHLLEYRKKRIITMIKKQTQ